MVGEAVMGVDICIVLESGKLWNRIGFWNDWPENN
jgi:hypothetical protein